MILLATAHFSILIVFNMAHIAKGDLQELCMEGLRLVQHCSGCSAYTAGTGLLGGYGFYSPSVGNTYQIQFCRYERQSKRYYNSPGLKSQAAQMRFQSYLDISTALLDTAETKEKQQAKASITKACQHLLLRMPCDSLEAKLISKYKSNHISLYRYVGVPEKHP
jgi:hypothetical protein